MSSEEVVRLENISVTYNDTTVLESVNFLIHTDDFLGIIGPNGGGKTTLLKVILGLVTPRKGKVTVLGKSAMKSRKFIGYVPQTSVYDRDFPINVWNVVLMGRYRNAGLIKRYSSIDKDAANKALVTMKIADLKNRQVGKLSGGEQQRVLIARALASEPKLLLLDEPTASVDPAMQTEFYEILNQLKSHIAIVLVSHDISAISIYVNKIACLNRQMFYHGTKEISSDILEATYKCPVQMIAHGTIPHRILKEH